MSEREIVKSHDSKTALRLIGILSLAGLAIAAYLAVTYTQDQAPYCGVSGGCESVKDSEYVTIIDGLLDVPRLGVIGYLVLLTLTMLRGRLGEQAEFYLPVLTFGVTLIGFLYSTYLTYLEAFVIHAWCYWCLASATLMTAIFVLSSVDLRHAWPEA
jgi:uncharacterized membrane protein